MLKLRSVFLFLLIVAVSSLGCGGPARYSVSGTVKYKDAPIKAGTISFIPEGAQSPAGGAPIVDGRYDIPAVPGLPTGKYKVAVSSQQGGGEVGEMPGVSNPQPKELIPEKYNGKTELTADVKAGSTTFNFDLK